MNQYLSLFIKSMIKPTVSLIPNTYRNLSNILVSDLIPYVQGIVGDNRCEFRRNR
jgi:hypothetical protein